jgi:hypothetical protein
MLKSGELSRKEINKIVRDYVQVSLEELDEGQATSKPGNPGLLDEQLESFDAAVDHLWRYFTMNGHVQIKGTEVDRILDGLNFSLDKDSPSYQLLCYELLRT